MMGHVISWFEIPVADMARARKFYEKALGVKLQMVRAGGMAFGMFPADWNKGEIGGALIKGKGYAPGTKGPVVYLNAEPGIQAILDRVPQAGGKVLLPKTRIPMEGAGFMAFFKDSEGNRIGLAASR